MFVFVFDIKKKPNTFHVIEETSSFLLVCNVVGSPKTSGKA